MQRTYSNIWGMLLKLPANSKGWVSQGQAEQGGPAQSVYCVRWVYIPREDTALPCLSVK